MINELAKEIHELNKARGFYETEKNIGEMLCLIHSEVSEALECDRNGKSQKNSAYSMEEVMAEVQDQHFKRQFELQVKDSFEDELADIMIRVMDLAAFKKIDLEAHIYAKLRYNSLRPYRHGKKY